MVRFDPALKTPPLASVLPRRISMKSVGPCLLFILPILFASTGIAQVSDFLATGRAEVTAGDTLPARDAALSDAREKAIEGAILEESAVGLAQRISDLQP